MPECNIVVEQYMQARGLDVEQYIPAHIVFSNLPATAYDAMCTFETCNAFNAFNTFGTFNTCHVHGPRRWSEYSKGEGCKEACDALLGGFNRTCHSSRTQEQKQLVLVVVEEQLGRGSSTDRGWG